MSTTLDHLPDDELDRLYMEHASALFHFTKIDPDPDAAALARQHLDTLRDEMHRRGISCG